MSQNTQFYDSTKSKNPALDEIKEILKFKDLIVQLVRRDIVTRYKRSSLGIIWTMLNPLGTMIIMSIVFSRLFDLRGAYPAFIITNLVAWNFFAQTTAATLSNMIWGSDLFQRIYLPRTSIVISTIGTGIINILFSLVPLAVIYLFTKTPISETFILLPIAILFLAAFALGFSLILSAIGVFFPDVSEMYPIVLTAWMYLTPIIYPEEMIADVVNGWLLRLNPLYHLIKFFRLVTFDGLYPTTQEFITALVLSFGVLIIGWIFFTRQAKKFAYYV
jgi:ABC-2 type transport system permease protein